MAFKREDVESVFKTNPIEESLLVLQASGTREGYIEYAVVKVTGRHIKEDEIRRWIDGIDRFRDCYVHEAANPVSVRFRQKFYPVEFIVSEPPSGVDEIMTRLTAKPITFDVQKPPLFKVIVFHDDSDAYLCLVYHHLLMDGISIQMALASLDPGNRVIYADWRPVEKKYEKQFTDLTPFLLEPLVPPPAAHSIGYHRISRTVTDVSYENLMLAWIDFLQQSSGKEEIVVGEVLSARGNDLAAQQALGYFVQTWPLVFNGKQTLESIGKIRSECIAVADGWVNRYFPQNCLDQVWVVEPFHSSGYEVQFRSTPHYLLTLVFRCGPAGLAVEFCWNLSKIDGDAAQQITDSFWLFFEGLGSRGEAAAEFEAPPYNTLLEWWDDVVKQYADKVAVEDLLGNRLTYKEVDDRANRLSKALDVLPGSCVGVHVDYSVHIPISFLAVLKRGAIYVPLDPVITESRMDHIRQDAGIKVIISDFPAAIASGAIAADTDGPDLALPEISSDADDICYLIYTSGTTGNPKGCAVNHGNLINLFHGTCKIFGFNPDDRWIMAHSYGFDFTTWEIWGCLLSGGKLLIPSRQMVQDTFAFYELLTAHSITILNQTPKAFDNLMLVAEEGGENLRLRHIIFGGDKLHYGKLNGWRKRFPGMKLTNMYGITETTVHVTWCTVGDDIHSNIGRALPGYRMSLVNSFGNPVAKGFLGEIYVYGKGVCNGYYRNPDLTAVRFGERNGERFYRSGDVGWQVGLDTFYLGRQDRQVKVRGHRIELGEIEFLLAKKVPGIRFNVMFIEQQLICFYKGGLSDIQPDHFRGYMSDYSIPVRFIRLEDFPLNQSGKIDEKVLLERSRLNQDGAGEGGEDPLLMQALKEVLGQKIDPAKSFVRNGGDSISAIRVIHFLRKSGRLLRVQDLFEHTAISNLRTQMAAGGKQVLTDELRLFHERTGLKQTVGVFYFPLTPAQEGILFDCLSSVNFSLYTEQLTYSIPSSYSFGQIRDAYRAVCQVNPLLLAVVHRDNGRYFFKVNLNSGQECLSGNADDYETFLEQDFNRGFDLHSGLSRLTVFNSEKTTRIVWTHHHLLLDGWSLGVFSREMLKALAGEQLAYHDEFIRKTCRLYLADAEDFFVQSGIILPTCERLPPPLPARNHPAGYLRQSYYLDVPIMDSIRENGYSLHAFAITAWSVFLGSIYRQRAVTLGSVVSLRGPDEMDTLGMYIRTLPFTIDIDGSAPFRSHLINAAALLRKVDACKDAPMKENTVGNFAGHLFVFENYPVDFGLLDRAGIQVERFREMTGSPWTTVVYPEQQGFRIDVLFDTAEHDTRQVDRLLSHFNDWLKRLEWDNPVSFTEGKLKREAELIGPPTPFTEKNILEILHRVSAYPAIVGEGLNISYQALWSMAEAISDNLKAVSCSAGEPVGIDVSSTTQFVTCVLGVWLAGAVPVPVDRRYPESRKKLIYDGASVRIVLHGEEAVEITLLHNHPITLTPDASFVLHTSGSTGQPKGVIQTHDCLINLIRWNRSAFGLSSDEIILQLSSFGFDASFHEILLALTLGATLVEVPVENRLDIHAIRNHLKSFHATMAWIPARLLNSILDVDADFFVECKSLRRIVTTGEALVLGQALKDYVRKSGVSLLNFYGPTETHVVTAFEVNAGNCTTQPSIGRALDNTIIRLTNENGNPVPAGLPGEIHVAGKHVAQGYLNDPDQTARRFYQTESERWYKTGDWAFTDQSGLLHFIGRKDDQVKIRGFRVEPLEVERTIMELPGVSQCCVIVFDGALHAFLVKEGSDDVQSLARVRLPDYMFPSTWHELREMPVNSNGKADRAALRLRVTSVEPVIGSADSSMKSFVCWKSVLGHERFGRESHFNAVGGNSILLMKMQAWIEKNAGIFVSIRDLLDHDTPAALERLLLSRAIEPVTVSSRFPLSELQRAILVMEAGNDYGAESPFLLGFRVKLAREVSYEKWQGVVMDLLEQYPHLKAGLSGGDDLSRAEWHILVDREPFFTPLLHGDVKNGKPLIRFLHHSDTEVSINWHHALLDGLGMQVLTSNLMVLLDNQFQQRAVPVISQRKPTYNARIKTCALPATVVEHVIATGQVEQVRDFCQRSRIKESIFWFYVVACTHETCWMAATDVDHHPGFPGMFTELRPVFFDLKASDPSQWMVDTGGNAPEMSVVVNYMMMTGMKNDWIKNIEFRKPTRLKYLNEWQLVLTDDGLQISYFSAHQEVDAAEKLSRLLAGVDRLLRGKLFFERAIADKKDLFDDFDF